MIPFAAGPAGVTAGFTTDEAELLSDLAEQLIALLEDRAAESPADLLYAQLGIGGADQPPLDPALARLLPDAYRGDSEAASEHRHFTERGLIDRKAANARAVIDSLEDGRTLLDPAAVQAWLRTLTDLRLTIAARLEIESDDDEGRAETETDLALHAVYDWLGYLQGSLVEVIDR